MGKNLNLVWLDLEMTGLIPRSDRIIEIATLVTDPALNILAEGPVFAIKQPDEVLNAMDEWNQKHHGISGLIDRVKNSPIDEQEAERQTLEFLTQYSEKKASPLCGNSICQDRRFMANYMPELEAFFHYRNLDVSSVKELVRRWKPQIMEGFSKQSKHQAMDDIKDSVNELKYYREHFIKA
ncbi:MAG: oligoribonuclease [Gammaproteobacteria bacterium]|jgi:oligoribonuclease|nr:oligoribonuclease [Gammaproteobacteria bacterium]MCH2576906.1 oligoribonuclease [Pseudomonadales bacterium]MEC7767039.1 oligoribonuclease [Pseudomonadota bacterium]MBI91057.1 oligoribonuclease [Gammaproteobacteria bacterium]MEC9218796.1 oligoribonuclease [Pseudomonadota bacterium]|tara:strand:- start:3551 stop:4093 length:543 start_codon:yes stop_codon:yes gene_type:complete